MAIHQNGGDSVAARYEAIRKWNSQSADRKKFWAQRLSIGVIGLGALTSFWVALKPSSPDIYDWLIALTGVAVAIAEGTQKVMNFEGLWRSRRQLSEDMKRELRLFDIGQGDYAHDRTDREAVFVERMEALIRKDLDTFRKDDALG